MQPVFENITLKEFNGIFLEIMISCWSCSMRFSGFFFFLIYYEEILKVVAKFLLFSLTICHLFFISSYGTFFLLLINCGLMVGLKDSTKSNVIFIIFNCAFFLLPLFMLHSNAWVSQYKKFYRKTGKVMICFIGRKY